MQSKNLDQVECRLKKCNHIFVQETRSGLKFAIIFFNSPTLARPDLLSIKKIVLSICLLMLITIFTGCSVVDRPKFSKKREFFKKPGQAVKEYFVKDFIKIDDDLKFIKDQEVTVNLLQPVTLPAFFQILIDQNVNLVAHVNSQTLISMPQFSGQLRDLLKSIQISHGLFIQSDSGVIIIKEVAPVYVKVLMPGIQENLLQLINSFGIEKSYYDELSSRIVFESDFYTYKKIENYFKNNPYLTLVVFDVLIIENEENNNKSSGIDWSKFAASLSDISKLPFALSAQGDGQLFNLSFKSESISLDAIYHSLLEFEKFEILQSARISTLNGSSCMLDVSEKIPYVEKVTLGSLSSNSNEVVKGYDFGVENSGLVLNLKPSVSDDIISLNFKAEIQSVIDFLEVGTSQESIKQPVVSKRNITNQIVLNPGETSLIGGLRYQKGKFSDSSLTWLKKGLKSSENRIYSVSILIRSEIVRYVFS